MINLFAQIAKQNHLNVGIYFRIKNNKINNIVIYT